MSINQYDSIVGDTMLPGAALFMARRLSAAALDLLAVVALGLALWMFFRPHSSRSDQDTSMIGQAPGPQPVAFVQDTINLFEEADSRQLLLYVFRTDCPACGMQKQDWNALATLAENHGTQVVALTLEELDAVNGYFSQPSVLVGKVLNPSATYPSLGVRVVPTTILVGVDQRILAHHSGILSIHEMDTLGELLAE